MCIRLPLAVLVATVFACSMQASPAQAQRVFVGATGSDSNPCTFASPCRSFQHAHDVAPANGEIDVLDPAGYGALTINKSISIQGHGYAGVAVPSGDGITITAGPKDIINLRGLLLDGIGSGGNGINFSGGAFLSVEDSVFHNFTEVGIQFAPTASSNLFISNSLVSENSIGAAVILNGSFNVSGILDRVQSINNSEGIDIIGLGNGPGKLQVAASGCRIINNGNNGLYLTASVSLAASVVVRNCSIADNGGVGINVPINGKVYVTGSTLTGNATGVSIGGSGGVALSRGDNEIDDNRAVGYDLQLQSAQ